MYCSGHDDVTYSTLTSTLVFPAEALPSPSAAAGAGAAMNSQAPASTFILFLPGRSWAEGGGSRTWLRPERNKLDMQVTLDSLEMLSADRSMPRDIGVSIRVRPLSALGFAAG